MEGGLKEGGDKIAGAIREYYFYVPAGFFGLNCKVCLMVTSVVVRIS